MLERETGYYNNVNCISVVLCLERVHMKENPKVVTDTHPDSCGKKTPIIKRWELIVCPRCQSKNIDETHKLNRRFKCNNCKNTFDVAKMLRLVEE